ncbi:uncharacterized protein HaLaN_28823 [Haematococcus lacustris]|uniref:Uncharacterized protein n=1 Tax=Haematococcus lacustris TaxID=44745 RepID=A0A6A0AB26_HAELA|nr:uncharacterized protein HaLaN_28823 [Haematococcus lacustris]
MHSLPSASSQDLRRGFSWVCNAACAYSILSVWGVVEYYSTQGLAYGGPVAVIWGWVLVSCFSMAIALCMAELVSAFPTSGGLYYWSYMLAPVRYRRLACWMTGWLNLLGQVAFTACLEVALTHYIAAHVRLYTTGRNEEPGYDMTTQELLGVFTALHVVHAVLNSLGQSATRVMVVFSGWWNTVATLGFCAMLLCVAPKHQSPAFVFTQWLPGSEASGITSPPYIFMVSQQPAATGRLVDRVPAPATVFPGYIEPGAQLRLQGLVHPEPRLQLRPGRV